MYFIKKLFKKECLQFLGRVGILYFDGFNEYYIETQNFVPNVDSKSNYSVIIFYKEIIYNQSDTELNEGEKAKIASKVQTLLDKKRIISTIE